MSDAEAFEGWAPLAVFSPDRLYRYRLERRYLQPFPGPNNGTACFVLLNPSTADETNDDPTIRRCIDFARRWGYGRLVVVNLFGFRATKPKDLRKAGFPEGPENIGYIMRAAMAAELVVCAWGAPGAHRNTGKFLRMKLLDKGIKAKAFGFCQNGEPWHPLYLRRDMELVDL